MDISFVVTAVVVLLTLVLVLRWSYGYSIDSYGVMKINESNKLEFSVETATGEFNMAVVFGERERPKLIDAIPHFYVEESSVHDYYGAFTMNDVCELGEDAMFFHTLFSGNFDKHWSFTRKGLREDIKTMIIGNIETHYKRENSKRLKDIEKRQLEILRELRKSSL